MLGGLNIGETGNREPRLAVIPLPTHSKNHVSHYFTFPALNVLSLIDSFSNRTCLLRAN